MNRPKVNRPTVNQPKLDWSTVNQTRLTLALVLSLVVAGLAGCVSSSSAPPPPAQSPADAAEYNLQLGISYFRQGNLQAARAKLERAIEQKPGLAPAHSALGLVYEGLDDLDGAERNYRRAMSLDGEDPDILNALAVFLCGKRGRNAEALRLFDRAIAIPLSRKAANRAMLNTNAGTCAKYADPARAEEYLRRALAEDPRFPDALLQMGEVSLDRGKALQARGFVERYLDVAKASPAVLWLGVRVERALGDGAAARRYGDQLVKEFPEAGETRQFLAQPERQG